MKPKDVYFLLLFFISIWKSCDLTKSLPSPKSVLSPSPSTRSSVSDSESVNSSPIHEIKKSGKATTNKTITELIKQKIEEEEILVKNEKVDLKSKWSGSVDYYKPLYKSLSNKILEYGKENNEKIFDKNILEKGINLLLIIGEYIKSEKYSHLIFLPKIQQKIEKAIKDLLESFKKKEESLKKDFQSIRMKSKLENFKNELNSSFQLIDGKKNIVLKNIIGIQKLKDNKINLNLFEKLFELDRLESLFKNFTNIDKKYKSNPDIIDIFVLSNELWLVGKRIEIVFEKNLENLDLEYKNDCLPNDIKCKIFELFKKLLGFYKTNKEAFKNFMFSFENSLDIKNLKISFQNLIEKIKERIEKSLDGKENEFFLEKYTQNDTKFYRLVEIVEAIKIGIKLNNELNTKSKDKSVKMDNLIKNLLAVLQGFGYEFGIKGIEIAAKQLVEIEENKIPEIFKTLTKREYNSENESDVIEFEFLKEISNLILYFNEYKQETENKYKQNKETNPEMFQKDKINDANSEINSSVGKNETDGSDDDEGKFGTPKGSTESFKSVQSNAN